MSVYEVRLFAGLANQLGGRTIDVTLPTGATGAELVEYIVSYRPEAAELLRACRVAVDCEFADPAAPLPAKAEIALIPPVSGG